MTEQPPFNWAAVKWRDNMPLPKIKYPPHWATVPMNTVRLMTIEANRK